MALLTAHTRCITHPEVQTPFPALGVRCDGESHWVIRSPVVELDQEWGVED
ncbi:hypothetical protein [Nostoc sp.]|uniref:hypothetical protein n=1 Tax=Nostoc sp. TaxID=1180 RepID=UPI002FFABD93